MKVIYIIGKPGVSKQIMGNLAHYLFKNGYLRSI